MKEFKAFWDAVNDPSAVAAGIKSKAGKKIMGHVCSYAPEELIHGAGFHPMRIFPGQAEVSLADNHLQSYCCSLVRGILEDCLAGNLDYLSGMVFPHTCDSIMRLSDIIRLKGQFEFFADVLVPSKLDTASAKAYLGQVLERFRQDLERAEDREVTDREIAASIRLFNSIRKNLSRLFELKSKHPGLIFGKDLYAVVRGAMIMDRNELARHLERLVQKLEEKEPPPFAGRRLVLAGSACTMPEIHSLIEQGGGAIVADDLCTGQRWADGQIDPDMPPMEGLVERYAQRMVCPAKHAGIHARGDRLLEIAKEHGAHGVIFLLVKFCDPHAFDLPYLKSVLDQAGIKSQVLELPEHQQGMGQAATRLETFIQMI
ncbi:2-hydroxyacyl-CoA dehydratase subunit D [Desulfospira joergensenii]|uniref:2-hydroxyacyl-CoA dehydratase subunit D n=1 Tax=Desulfospira joergensenii TaxID=53329 RepID=UPI0003B36ABE|nr:2-hydroxyacyl-CoA dehydratase family protein [Desulfospira joergensenii]